MNLVPYIRMTPSNLAFLLLFACSACPVMGATLYGIFRLVFGTLYPIYASYKAVKTKNVKEYVKWMMYWIVFGLFSCAETFTDVFVSWWFPFYYEIKIVLVLWLLSPATRGSSILYRKFVHPQLVKREKDIDEYLNRAREQGYHAVVQLGSKGFNYASQVLVQTALKSGGQIVNHLQRSYSLSDLEPQGASNQRALAYQNNRHPDQGDVVDLTEDEVISALDDVIDRHSVHEVSTDEPESPLRRHTPSPLRLGRGRSRKGEDPSSGYSSAENLSTGASLIEPSAPSLSRQSLRIKGSRTATATQLPHISQLHSKRSLQQLEIGSSATLPRAKRSTRRPKTNVS